MHPRPAIVVHPGFLPQCARLNRTLNTWGASCTRPYAWRPSTPSGAFWQVDLGSVATVYAIATKGTNISASAQYVSRLFFVFHELTVSSCYIRSSRRRTRWKSVRYASNSRLLFNAETSVISGQQPVAAIHGSQYADSVPVHWSVRFILLPLRAFFGFALRKL